MPPELIILDKNEHLNMIHHVPELGVVAVGNQAGRVILLTLTRCAPPALERHGFKIEAIVPYRSEEARGCRPEEPLMGIAISPIQGQNTKECSPNTPTSTDDKIGRRLVGMESRYRLLLIYQDHTVLSYIISRPIPDEPLLVL